MAQKHPMCTCLWAKCITFLKFTFWEAIHVKLLFLKLLLVLLTLTTIDLELKISPQIFPSQRCGLDVFLQRLCWVKVNSIVYKKVRPPEDDSQGKGPQKWDEYPYKEVPESCPVHSSLWENIEKQTVCRPEESPGQSSAMLAFWLYISSF